MSRLPNSLAMLVAISDRLKNHLKSTTVFRCQGEHSAYHHGEQSLSGTIVAMAQELLFGISTHNIYIHREILGDESMEMYGICSKTLPKKLPFPGLCWIQQSQLVDSIGSVRDTSPRRKGPGLLKRVVPLGRAGGSWLWSQDAASARYIYTRLGKQFWLFVASMTITKQATNNKQTDGNKNNKQKSKTEYQLNFDEL